MREYALRKKCEIYFSLVCINICGVRQCHRLRILRCKIPGNKYLSCCHVEEILRNSFDVAKVFNVFVIITVRKNEPKENRKPAPTSL